jgi:hypothetical protein
MLALQEIKISLKLQNNCELVSLGEYTVGKLITTEQ